MPAVALAVAAAFLAIEPPPDPDKLTWRIAAFVMILALLLAIMVRGWRESTTEETNEQRQLRADSLERLDLLRRVKEMHSTLYNSVSVIAECEVVLSLLERTPGADLDGSECVKLRERGRLASINAVETWQKNRDRASALFMEIEHYGVSSKLKEMSYEASLGEADIRNLTNELLLICWKIQDKVK